MGDLLHCLLVYNCDDEEKRFRLEQEARNSNEWLVFAREIARVASAAPQDSSNLAEPSGPASGKGVEPLPSPAPVRESKTKAARGPKANMVFHRAIAKIVKPFREEWRNDGNLERIVEQLDKDQIKPREIWASLNPPARTWKRALSNYPERVL